MVHVTRNMSPRYGRNVENRFPELAPADAEGFEDDTLLTLDDLDDLEGEEVDAAESALLASVMSQTSQVVKKTRPTPKTEPKAEPVEDGFRGWNLPGFEAKCRVCTSFGDLPIEALRRRDLVKTFSGAYREVQWVDALHLDVDFLARYPQALPVLLRAKSLGGSYPARNMLVSPAQDIWQANASRGYEKRKAGELLDRPGFMTQQRSEITYYRFHCGEPVRACIEGSYFDIAPPV